MNDNICTARIRPFHPVNEIELRCELETAHPTYSHASTLRDYAYPGSRTVMSWVEDDRRTFHGEWPGNCSVTVGCTLPAAHHGRCAP